MLKGDSLAKGLLWGGIALILLPFAVVCGALMVALALQSPTVGLIVLIVVGSLIARIVNNRKERKS